MQPHAVRVAHRISDPNAAVGRACARVLDQPVHHDEKVVVRPDVIGIKIRDDLAGRALGQTERGEWQVMHFPNEVEADGVAVYRKEGDEGEDAAVIRYRFAADDSPSH